MKVIKMKNKNRDGEVREIELGWLYTTSMNHFISVDSIEIFFRIFDIHRLRLVGIRRVQAINS